MYIEWFSYITTEIMLSVMMFFIVDIILFINDKNEETRRQMKIELSSIERNNEKLLDYQEKVKSTNEQINYQKIELTRAFNNLEQINSEIESQSKLMEYMASTFDVLKCMNAIADSIMEVKNPKLCMFYLNKDVYQNKDANCIIKTNYTSMQRRLKKEIDSIYENYILKSDKLCTIYRDEQLKDFSFIGDANLNSIALFQVKEKKKIIGFILVGSDIADFFHKSTSYYENCILGFVSSLKSTKLYLQMEEIARKDGLTGIYNRVYNNELFKKVTKEAQNKKSFLSVALFDIDKFKKINDTYGHFVGDEVIKMVSGIANKYAEEYLGFACRYGGEEFLVTLPGYNEVEAMKILEAMHDEIKTTTVKAQGFEVNVNVCIGVSSYPNICDEPDKLVNRADKAMYYGKNHGRGRLVLDNPDLVE